MHRPTIAAICLSAAVAVQPQSVDVAFEQFFAASTPAEASDRTANVLHSGVSFDPIGCRGLSHRLSSSSTAYG